MTNEEKRREAAYTLVVPYDATPAAVDAAYENRVKQYLDVASDEDMYFKKMHDLYNARIRMRMSPSRQWLANTVIRLSGRFERECAALLALVKVISSDIGARGYKYNEELSKLILRVRELEREKKIICLFEMAGVWIVPNIDNMYASMAGFAAMFGAACRMAWCMETRDKKIEQFTAKSSKMMCELFFANLQDKTK